MDYSVFKYVGGFLAIIVIGGFVYFIGKGDTKKEAFRSAVDQIREYFQKKKDG